MRKEIIFAVAIGILFGTAIAFGVWRANKAIKINQKEESFTQNVTQEKPEPEKEFKISLLTPEENDVITDSPVKILGLTKENAWMAISAEEKDYILLSNEKGEFEQEVGLVGGINQIIIFAFSEQGLSISKNLTLVYSTEILEKEDKTSPGGSTGLFILKNSSKILDQEKATGEADRIQEKVKERLDQTKNKLKAYIGTVTDISNKTIQLKNKNDEIQLISFSGETTLVKIDKTSQNIKIDDLSIADFIVAMGYVGENQTLEAERILSLKPPASPGRNAVFGFVENVSKNQISLKDQNNNEYTFVFDSKTQVTLQKEGEIIKSKNSEIEKGDNLIIMFRKDEERLLARRIHIVSQLTPSPTPADSEKE